MDFVKIEYKSSEAAYVCNTSFLYVLLVVWVKSSEFDDFVLFLISVMLVDSQYLTGNHTFHNFRDLGP